MTTDAKIALIAGALGAITWLVLCQREHVKRRARSRKH